MTEKAGFSGWAILELMGHRRLAGHLSEQEIAGSPFVRIDIPGQDGAAAATQFYSPSAVYCVTPVAEELARSVAATSYPEPVKVWELPAPRVLSNVEEAEYADPDDLPFD